MLLPQDKKFNTAILTLFFLFLILLTSLAISQEEDEYTIQVNPGEITEVFSDKNSKISWGISSGTFTKKGDGTTEIVLGDNEKIVINGRDTIIDLEHSNKIILDKNGELDVGNNLKFWEPIEIPIKGRNIFIGTGDSISTTEKTIFVESANDPVFEPELTRELTEEEKDTVIVFNGPRYDSRAQVVSLQEPEIEIDYTLDEDTLQGHENPIHDRQFLQLENGDFLGGSLKYKYTENGGKKGHQAFIDGNAILEEMEITNEQKKEIHINFGKYEGQDEKNALFLDSGKKNFDREIILDRKFFNEDDFRDYDVIDPEYDVPDAPPAWEDDLDEPAPPIPLDDFDDEPLPPDSVSNDPKNPLPREPTSKKIESEDRSLTMIGDGSYSIEANRYTEYLRFIAEDFDYDPRNYHLKFNPGKNGDAGQITIKGQEFKGDIAVANAKGEYEIEVGTEIIKTGINEDGSKSVYIDSGNKNVKSNARSYPISVIPQNINDDSYIIKDSNGNPKKIIVGERDKLIIVNLDQKVTVPEYDRFKFEDVPSIEYKEPLYNLRRDVGEPFIELGDINERVSKEIAFEKMREARNILNANAVVRINIVSADIGEEGQFLPGGGARAAAPDDLQDIFSTGSGTIIGEDINGDTYILISAHQTNEYRVGNEMSGNTLNGDRFIAEIVNRIQIFSEDPADSRDSALLKITDFEGTDSVKKLNLPYIPIAPADYQVNLGDEALMIGYPSDYKQCHLNECKVIFGSGLTTDEAARVGMSGGPLVTLVHDRNVVSTSMQIGITNERRFRFKDSIDWDSTSYSQLYEIHELIENTNDENGNPIIFPYLQRNFE